MKRIETETNIAVRCTTRNRINTGERPNIEAIVDLTAKKNAFTDCLQTHFLYFLHFFKLKQNASF
jgi:hypothetical protein